MIAPSCQNCGGKKNQIKLLLPCKLASDDTF